ncbi:MAG: chromosome segregation protein SMC [Chloroflexi bacterium]|nr:chromosome segregation protein SMC [Chloroflexota bacterium]
MWLKSIEVQGYKSFANKTSIVFPGGITAVVGPNGSGKSNIADALRWVLGEQSVKSLRAKKTEDLIFAGSTSRARMGMAQVSMTLDNQTHWLPVDYQEVTLTRRTYRSGETEYLLNGTKVRLRDLQDLLAQGGLGRDGYTIIGQGMIDQALALRPEERRLLLDEAAGITGFQARRDLALGRLKETEDNLTRVQDILEEIGPRVRRLQSRAERAYQHQRLSTELKDLLHRWYASEWVTVQSHWQATVQQEAFIGQQLMTARERLQSLERQQQDVGRLYGERRGMLEKLQTEREGLRQREGRARRDMAVLQERRRLLEQQVVAGAGEVDSLAQLWQKEQAALAAFQVEQSHLEDERQGNQQDLAMARKALAVEQEAQQAWETQIQAARKEVLRLTELVSDRRNWLQQAHERQVELKGHLSAAQQQLGQQAQAIAVLRQEERPLQGAMEQAEGELEELADEVLAVEQQARLARQKVEEGRHLWQQAQRQRDQLLARRDVFHGVRASYKRFDVGVRRLLEQSPGQISIIGALATFLQVPLEFERAIEAALGPWLQALVVPDMGATFSGLAWVLQHPPGRTTFLTLAESEQEISDPPPEYEALKAHEAGILGWAPALIQYDRKLEGLVKRLLGHVLLVRDLPVGELVLRHVSREVWIVTLDGTLLSPKGIGSAGQEGNRGQAEAAGLLASEREWRETEELLAVAEERLAEFDQILAAAETHEKEIRAAVERLTRRQSEIRRFREARRSELEKRQRQLDRLEQEHQWHNDLARKQQAEAEQLESRVTLLLKELEGAKTQLEIARVRLDQLQEEMHTRPIGAFQEQVTRFQTALTVLEGKLQTQEKLVREARSRLEQLASQRRNRQAQQARLQEDLEGCQEQLLRQETEIAAVLDVLKAVDGQIVPAEASISQIEIRQKDLGTEIGRGRRELQGLEMRHNEILLEVQRRKDRLQYLQQQLALDGELVEADPTWPQQLQLDLPLLAISDQLAPIGQGILVPPLPADAEEQIRRLRKELGKLGTVDLDAAAEYEELRQRHHFLSTQSVDLQKAAEDLQRVILELDQVMERRFEQTFKQTAEAFSTYFTQLFGGGSARLALVNGEDGKTVGVEILARPPGKRSQSLALLSGGERSLTATALLFALLRASPTPFCVLDEVDAALDEANVGRFRQTLQELGKDVQFVVITHNRGTIECASSIYGVSMAEDGVSQIISMRLEDVSSAA